MKFGKLIFLLFAFSFVFLGQETRAQDSKTAKQIKILNNYGAIPFEDGKTIVTEVVFTGLDVNYTQSNGEEENLLTENRLSEILKQRRAEINSDDLFRGSKVATAAKVIRDWLAGNGYDKAEVAAFGEKLPKNQMKLVFAINRGALARVSEIVFEGNVNLTNDELVIHLKKCAGDNLEIFDQRKFDYFLRKCSLRQIQSKGYFKGKIENVSRRLADNGYVVTVKVEESVRYRIGEIKIEGAKVFTKKELLEILGQKEGEVADGEKLQDFIYEKLKNLYADKGYILYNGEFDPEFIEPQAEGLDGIVNLAITIDEGKAFSLRRLRFSGIDAETEKRLKAKFSLKDGETYNQSKFKGEIKKINETKEFYFIDNDQDVELRTDEVEGDLDIVIKLQKIE